MPAIDFPASPAVNDEYSFEGRTWRWNGTGWEVKEYPAALALGSAANPSLYFTGDPNTGLYSPGADQVAISTGGVQRLLIAADGNISQGGTSTAASFIPTSSTVPTNGVYLPAANTVGVATNGVGRLFVDASGNIKVSTGEIFQTSASSYIRLDGGTGSGNGANVIVFGESHGSAPGRIALTAVGTGAIVASAGGSERLRITSAGNVGIGTTSPAALLDVTGGISALRGALAVSGQNALAAGANLELFYDSVNDRGSVQSFNRTTTAYKPIRLIGSEVQFDISNSERARIDSSGRLLVGTSTARTNIDYVFSTTGSQLQIEQAGATTNFSIVQNFDSGTVGAPAIFTLARSGASSIGSNAIVANGNRVGEINFSGSDGTDFTVAACIRGEVDGTPGANDMPGRLVFSTTADGASSPTERLRITSAGLVGIGTSSPRFSLSLGGTQSVSTANPDTIDLGGTYSNTAGQNLKLRLYWDANSVAGGLGVSLNSIDYVTFPDSAHTFYAGTTERARIDSSGRLLVGTSSSAGQSCLLQVRSDIGVNAEFFRSADNSGGPYIALTKTRGTAASPTEVSSGDDLGTFDFIGYDGATYRSAARIQAQADGTWTDGGDTTDNPGRLVFSVTRDGESSPTSAMRITNSGRTVVLGNTNAFDAYSEQGAGTSFELFIGGHSATTTAPGSGTTSFRVFTNGNVQNTNNSYGSLSDAKLKENIVDAGSQWNDLKSLQVRKYNFKEETGQQTHTQIGLVAQEVELVSPGLVSKSPDRDAEGNDLGTVTKSVNYSVLYMKAVKALQEAMERIETLEAKVAALEAA